MHNTLAMTLIAATLASTCSEALGYTPKSPKVQRMVSDAVRFIEGNHDSQGGSHYSKLGGKCIVGLAIFKHTGRADHPLVQSAVAKCQEACRQGDGLPPTAGENEKYNYSLGIAIIFLSDLDSARYKTEINILLNVLLSRQKQNGSWTYPAYKDLGDTSQTQYAVLALWMARRANIPFPQETIEGACGWLLRTQDPDGTWGYHGKDPGVLGSRVRQQGVRLSIAAAGLSSIYICADMLGFIGGQQERPTRNRLPAALREVGQNRRKRAVPVTNFIPPAAMQQSLQDGNDWFAENYAIKAPVYQHFYMYALERFMSFREYAERSQNPEPSWYNEGVEYLADTQDSKGQWDSSAGAVIDSAFAILFLLRSTKTSLGYTVKVAGRLRGGKLLPVDVSQIAIDSTGQAVSTKETPPIENLLELLEGLSAGDIDTSIPKQLTLSDDAAERTAQRARLRRLAVNGAYQARLTAVKTIGRDRDFENVPPLIFALSDPDPRIVRAARDGLRFISRKVNGFGLSDSSSEAQQQKAQASWKAWLRSVKP
jgi:hypothetical protein